MFVFKDSPLVIRNRKNSSNSVFLTFDDGPSSFNTENVLTILDQEKSPSTFFVIGERAKENPNLIKKIRLSGHKLYSHSIDHSYVQFFKPKKSLRRWVLQSIDQLQQITGEKSWGFRPPAGVVTPPLLEISEEESLPLFLWNHRFFDTQRLWTQSKADHSISKIKSGDIVLLHDRQKPVFQDQFLQTLRRYVRNLNEKKFHCAILEEQK